MLRLGPLLLSVMLCFMSVNASASVVEVAPDTTGSVLVSGIFGGTNLPFWRGYHEKPLEGVSSWSTFDLGCVRIIECVEFQSSGYATYDLSGIDFSSELIAASLTFDLGVSAFAPGFPAVVPGLLRVSAVAHAAVQEINSLDVGYFDFDDAERLMADLDGGQRYGVLDLNAVGPGSSVFKTPLNRAALESIAQGSGKWTVGLDLVDAFNARLSVSDDVSLRLIFDDSAPVPVASTLWLVLLSLAGISLRRGRGAPHVAGSSDNHSLSKCRLRPSSS